MSESRPDPIDTARRLQELASEWRTIEKRISNRDSAEDGASTQFGSTVPSATLMSLSERIDRFARFHARCLADEGDWHPDATDTPSLLWGLSSRVGHFTMNEDACLAWDFHDELEGLAAAAYMATHPDGRAWVDVGHRCQYADCNGHYRVRINRDNGHTPGWRPVAQCFTVDADGNERMNREHAVDGLLLAATADLVAA